MFGEVWDAIENLNKSIDIIHADAKDVEATKWRLATMKKAIGLIKESKRPKEILAITDKLIETISKK